jgi:hypothetical protein
LGIRNQLASCGLGHAFIGSQRTQVSTCASVLDSGGDNLQSLK